MCPINPYHVIHIGQLFEMLPKLVHSFGQFSTFFLYLPCSLYDLLVKYLVAICEVSHSRAENHGVLVHIAANLTFFGHEFYYRLAIFSFFENFVRLLKFFQINNLQKVDQADRTF